MTTVAFWAVVVLATAAQVWIVFQGVFFMRLWEDEAFNLTVPLNLVNGLGYTSDGALSGSQLSTFDPRISTGPVVLLPIAAVIALGADPVVGGRLVVFVFYGALVAGLWLLGGRLGGRWAALAAVCVPLGWNTWNSGSPIQSPVDILGEVPAAALLVWAFVVLRKRPWLAGLFIGLAMQTKLLSALAAIPIALALYLLTEGSFLRRAGRVLVCAAVAIVPNVLYELWKLVALGPAGYWKNLHEFYWFFTSGGQNIDPVDPLKKLSALGSGWYSPTWATLACAAIVVAAVAFIVVLAIVRLRADDDNERPNNREPAVFAIAAVLGLIIWFGWWLTSTHTPNWPRYPAIAMYVFVPIIVAVAIRALSELWRAKSWRVPGQVVSALAGAVVVVTLGVQTWGHVQIADESRFGETLADQRAIAADISQADLDVIVTSWGPNVSLIVLAGSRVVLDDVPKWDGTPELWRNWDSSAEGKKEFAEKLRSDCDDVLTRERQYALCALPTKG
ncbi:glycosyltransferase family 39 protein [Paramicrobacterium fandaimingii]|uniref:glycosyltransferase family 39 protein n=1 Tax=Paramicrobacterium fandaimingii TaxID=2708079 RepID=UPI00141EF034|nr:glycosyltransferase family 39 protein [Microbacterium fandaimingii]